MRLSDEANTRCPWRGYLTLAALCLALVLSGCHNYYESGLEALLAGNLDVAEQEAEEGLAEDPRDPWLHLLMARVLVAKEDWSRARPHAANAVLGLPDNATAHLIQGQVQAEIGGRVEACDHLLRARELDPGLAAGEEDRLRKLLPRAIGEALDNDLPSLAVRFILGLQELKPNHPDASEDKLRNAREALGKKLVRIGEFKQAEEHYAEMVAIYPDEPSFLLEQGAILMLLNRDEDAEARFSEYVGTSDNAESAKRMGAVAERAAIRGRTDIAEKYWLAGFEKDEDNDKFLLRLAELYFVEQRAEDGYNTLARYLEVQPNEVEPLPYIDAAKVAVKVDRGDIAIEILTRGNERARPYFALTDQLADLLFRRDRRGDMEKVLTQFVDRSIKEFGEEAELQARLDVLTWLERQKEYELAEYHLRKVLTREDKPQYWIRLARVLAAARKLAEMTTAVDRFLERSDRSVADIKTAASLLLEHHQITAAESIVKTGLTKHKNDDTLMRLLARVYREGGYRDREEKVWLQWINVQPDKNKARLDVGRAYARRNLHLRAIAILEPATKDDKYAADAWLAIGQSHQARGQNREMREAFEKFLAASEDRTRALETLLGLYRGRERAEDALRILEVLIEIRPDDPNLYHKLAEKHLMVGDTNSALDALDTYVKKSDGTLRAVRRAGTLLQRRGRTNLALELYERVLARKEPSQDMLADVGNLYLSLSRSFRRTNPARTDQLRDAAENYFRRYIEGYDKSGRAGVELVRLATQMSNQRLDRIALLGFNRARKLEIPLGAKGWLAAARSHLNLGQKENADKAFKQYLKHSKGGPPQNFKVGNLCFIAGAYSLAMKYLQKVLDSGDPQFARQAFEHMSAILIHTGERDKLVPLGLRVLEITKGTVNVRRMVAEAYLRGGLWDEAITEYRDLVRLRPRNNGNMVRKLAEAVYLSGDREQAVALFEESAKSSSEPGAAWQNIGQFYLERGENRRARDAFSRALNSGGGRAEALLWRGVVAALAGDIKSARADFEASLNEPGQLDSRFAIMVETFVQTGQRTLALELAERATVRAADPSPYRRTIATLSLERGNGARGLKEAEEWSKKSGRIGPQIELLRDNGYHLEALEILREELEDGDRDQAANLLFSDREILRASLEQLGADRFGVLYRPLMRGSDNPSALRQNIGDIYTDLGREKEATVHLAAASAGRGRTTDFLLAQHRARFGDWAEARGIFTRYIVAAGEDPAAFERRTQRVVEAYLVLGNAEEAEGLVRSLMARPGRESLLMATLVRVLLLRGQETTALDLVRNGVFAPLFTRGGGSTVLGASLTADFLETARAVEGAGFGEEAVRIVTEVAGSNEDLALILAAIELSARHDRKSVDGWIEQLRRASEGRDGAEIDIRLADALLVGGQPERLAKLLLGSVENPNDTLARSALRRLTAASIITGDEALLNRAMEGYLRGREDKLTARKNMGAILRRAGQYNAATRQYRAAVEMEPGYAPGYRALLDVELLAGQGRELLDTRRRLTQVTSVDRDEDIRFGTELTRGPDSRTAIAYWTELAETWPALSTVPIRWSETALLRGEDDQARAILEPHVSRSYNDPIEIERIFHILASTQRWELVLELADGTRRPEPKGGRAAVPARTPRSYLYIGAAHYSLGQRKKALEMFDRHTEVSPDPLTANLETASVIRHCEARGLKRKDVLQDALAYVERAADAAPDSPMPRLDRGEIRAENGDIGGAKEDFDAYLAGGDVLAVRGPAASGIVRMGIALLAAGADKDAERYLLKLARRPNAEPTRGVQAVLDAFEESARFREGLTFLRKHFPLLARDPAIDVSLASDVATLQSRAGDVDLAVDTFEIALARYPMNPTLQNNLAYRLAEAGRELDRAARLSRASLAYDPALIEDAADTRLTTDTTRGIYTDTLAWVHRKKGAEEQALAEQKLALRLIAGNADRAHARVLYTHLADIHVALGDKAAAREARLRARLFDPRLAPFPPQ